MPADSGGPNKFFPPEMRSLKSQQTTPYALIRKWERSQAWGVAIAMVPGPQIGVWDVLIPIVLVLNFMRNRERRELFVQNYLYTKMMALDAARDISAGKTDRKGALDQIRAKTDSALSAESGDIYSADIREKQMAEIELLIDHYMWLMQMHGKDYAELVRKVYPDREDYRQFLEKLKEKETAVIEAAGRTMGDKMDPDALATLRRETERLREKSIQTIYHIDADA